MIDITKIFRKYPNKWLALTDDDKVVCVGETLNEVVKKARSKGIEEPVTIKIPNPRFEFVLNVQPK